MWLRIVSLKMLAWRTFLIYTLVGTAPNKQIRYY